MTYKYDYNDFPLAYLITLRTYGTWLHGDEKSSVDRHGFNIYGTPRREENAKLKNSMLQDLKDKLFLFDKTQYEIVNSAISEVCEYRNYHLKAINIRSNHLHAVVSAQKKPKLIVEAFKSYSTRRLREKLLITNETIVWARGKSCRYLWKPRHVSLTVEYVLYGQDDAIPDIIVNLKISD